MEKPIQQAHVLFDFSPFDAREELDDKTQRCYQVVEQMIAGKSAKECHEIYLKHIALNPQHNTEELTMGLLVAILVDQEGQQSKYYRDVVSFSKDSLTLFSTYLNMIIIDRLSKLKEHSIKQIFWITHQLMKANLNTAENICSNLIRQTAGGDVSAKNLRLVESLLDLLIENRSWLVNSTNFMVPTIIYTFMRLIADHMNPAQSTIRQKEVEFVIGLIREKFSECLHIGRDFLRLLHNIIKVPEFEKLWQDIYNNPKSLHPSFQNPLALLTFRTPRRLIQSRLTFDMEKKISFLATQVKFGSQKKYQNWFHKQYLTTHDSYTLRCDLIRYICTIIHPSNEVLCSDIIPRWAIIGWLLTTCTTPASASNSKLTLFFDWLLYDSKVDNIMNIEPAILVMYYSIGSHPQVTAGLLEFLCRIPVTFSPKLAEHIISGLKRSLQQILEKRVIPSLAPLFDNPKHEPALRALIRETFPEFCANVVTIDNGITPNNSSSILSSNAQTNNAAANHINQPASSHQIAAKSPDISSESINSTLIPPESTIAASNKNQPINNDLANNLNHKSEHLIADQVGNSAAMARDDGKAFTWNGTENVNASYSHKQQNHDNKTRKSSLSAFNSSSSTTTLDRPSKRIKGISNVPDHAAFNDPSKNISKPSNPLPASGCVVNELSNTEILAESELDANPLKVIYPFMTIQNFNFKEALNSFDEPIRAVLEDLSVEKCNETRCNLMDRLISTVFDNSDQSTPATLKSLGHCMAYLIVDDFSTRIFPTSSQDNESLEESIATPFFVLCRSAFSSSWTSWTVRPMSLLASIAKYFDAAGFLVLYFLRVSAIVSNTSVAIGYTEFCGTAKRKLSKCLYDDLVMASTYDSEMFCFLLPSIFGEIATSGSFTVTGNVDLIRLVVSVVDPIALQDLVCLCLTGTAKVIHREEVMTLVESSLTWESWEQYCLWKLICAQSVPIENYLSVLPKLDQKANPEAMSCIILNLQKVSEPTVGMIQQLINCDSKPYVSSILRYWSMKTDTKELAKTISSLFDSRSNSPQVKRKGQTKAGASKGSSSLALFNEKILQHLEAIRSRAPKNKLLAQTDILEMLSQMEALCNDSQKKKYSDLFSNRPKPTKKQKKMEKDASV